MRDVTDALLVLGATTRLTRLAMTDSITDKARARVWEWAYRPTDPVKRESRLMLADGVSCPFCIGFHLGVVVLATYRITRGTRLAGAWRFGACALTLNEAVGHIAVRIGDTPE